MPAPLLTAQDVSGHVHLIVGSNPLANARCAKSIEAGAKVIVISHSKLDLHYALKKKVDEGLVTFEERLFQDNDLTNLGREEVDKIVDAVFITFGRNNPLSAHISSLCRRLRIPVNVTDAPNLCTFTLLSTHSDGPLHIGITTSGKGCKLASRIRREVASSLPPHLGDAIERLGTLRRRIWEEDHRKHDLTDLELYQPDDDDDAPSQKPNFNQLVLESDEHATKSRRIRWLSQICEYWSLRRLASITEKDIDAMLGAYSTINSKACQSPRDTQAEFENTNPQIFLAGSGPGSPYLLTIATYRAIQCASIILADKLVPEGVLELIPRRTTVHIARKFPGNAEAAQKELLELGLDALQKGMTVVRLKQGDPYIYGRGGEEYDFFRKNGFEPVVLPGITSSLSAPMFAAIPATHRSVADQILICTGTGRKGVAPTPPPYVKTQTVVFLMALHRLSSLIQSLTGVKNIDDIECEVSAVPWPVHTPCAVLERASCPDQRVIRTTLQNVVAAIEEEGSRPPGLLVVGDSCEVLMNTGGHKWVVEEGFKGFGSLTDQPVGTSSTFLGTT